ncbi:MAG: deoxyribonuclease [Deltaproteobacteria bacterium]|nr:deoxyribonuclease [Deltaproteobacteria bacterium]
MHIGFHISIAKGFDWTLKEANRLGCEVIQIFLRNPRSWKRKTWTDSDHETIKKLLSAIPVFAHLTYLPNLAKIDENEQNMTGLIHEVELCIELGLTVMVVHCGSHHNKIKGIKAVAKAINHVTSEYGIDVFIENSAGQGNSLGSNLEELSMIYGKIEEKEKVSLCIDTAHLFAAGYDIRALESWQRIISDIQALFGYNKIGFFHLNDSKAGLASRIDRHWHIGKGAIGSDVFKNILNDVRFKNLKGVMETPKINNMDEENMKVMRALLSPLVSRPSS